MLRHDEDTIDDRVDRFTRALDDAKLKRFNRAVRLGHWLCWPEETWVRIDQTPTSTDPRIAHPPVIDLQYFFVSDSPSVSDIAEDAAADLYRRGVETGWPRHFIVWRPGCIAHKILVSLKLVPNFYADRTRDPVEVPPGLQAYANARTTTDSHPPGRRRRR